MKIIVIDLETTGFNKYYDAIVEIGMVLVDTDTKEMKKIFDKVIKDRVFSEEKHKDSWIFNNTDLKIEDVINANSIEYYRSEIQELFNKYPITAFNMKFDSGFMKARNFKFKETKCLMETSRQYNKNIDRRGRVKVPNVEEIYSQFFPDEDYIEKHRGCDDAYHEGKILLKLVELKNSKLNESANT